MKNENDVEYFRVLQVGARKIYNRHHYISSSPNVFFDVDDSPPFDTVLLECSISEGGCDQTRVGH
jgi:hypothetical protein